MPVAVKNIDRINYSRECGISITTNYNKTMKTIFFTAVICLFTCGCSFSQTSCCPYIVNITILPTSPTVGDTIKIVTVTATPNLGSRISYTYTQQPDTFSLVGCFWRGNATQPRTFYDTTSIGLLAAGTYHINYIAYSSASSTSCTVDDTSLMTTSFQVSASSGLGKPDPINKLFSIYPNPFVTETTLHLGVPVKNATISIVNTLGQLVNRIKHINQQQVTLHRGNLPTGVYFIYLTEDNKQVASRKIIIKD